MKASLYLHLSNYLKSEIELNNIRIYTEYYISETNSRADIVIGYLDDEKIKKIYDDEGFVYIQQGVEPIAVFELKYCTKFDAKQRFQSDIDKVNEKHINTEEFRNCDFYLCFISEIAYKKKFFVDKSHKQNFRITELTAIWNNEKTVDDQLDWKSH